MKIYKLDNGYYCIAPKDFNYNIMEDKFLNVANVNQGSFAELYIIKVFKALFSNIENLETVYNLYYKDEYDTWTDYLYKKILFERDEVEILNSNMKTDETIFKIDIALVSYNIDNLLRYDENILDKLNSMIERCS